MSKDTESINNKQNMRKAITKVKKHGQRKVLAPSARVSSRYEEHINKLLPPTNYKLI